jgi:hypothetical protein
MSRPLYPGNSEIRTTRPPRLAPCEVRAQIANTPLTRDYKSAWKFYGNLS